MIRCSEAFRAIRFNRVAILRYTQGAWILTRGELVCYIVEIGAGGARNVLSAGRSEDSLSVVLRTGRWLHDGVIGCGDLTDRRHRLRLDRFASAEAGLAERELARLALVGGDAQPDRPVPTPSWHQEDRPSVLPVGIYACCVTAKLRRGYGGMGRRASGFVARVADGDNTAHQL
jgi:hypothetical protein